MTSKEKAKELVDKFAMYLRANLRYDEEANEEAKQCALISVDEILEDTKTEYQIQYNNGDWSREIGYKYSEYWLEVKQEIEKL